MRTISLTRDEAEMIVDILERSVLCHEPAHQDQRLLGVASQIRHVFGMTAREQEEKLRAEMGLTKRNL